MTFNFDSYVENSGPLNLYGIDFERACDWQLEPEELRALDYFIDVEGHTTFWARDLLNTNLRHDPKVRTFITCWAYEELFHNRALEKFRRAYDEQVSSNARAQGPARPLKEAFEALGTRFLGLWPRVQRATYLAWGAAAELTTVTGYVLLARRTRNPVLRELLQRICKDERKHFAFYYGEAKRALSTSAVVRRSTFQILSALWTPVGAGIKPRLEFEFLIRYLAEVDEGAGYEGLLEIDHMMARLPGFERFSKFESLLRDLAPRSYKENSSPSRSGVTFTPASRAHSRSISA